KSCARSFYDAFDVEEIGVAQASRPVRRFCGSAPDRSRGPSFADLGAEPAAGLEQPDVLAAAPPVMGTGVDQTREKRRPEHRVLLRQRIGDRRRFLTLRAEWQRGLAFDERER